MLSGDESTRPPGPGFDLARATVARVWNAAIGGKDNFEVDRNVVRAIRELVPGIAGLAIANHEFLLRACKYLAGDAGITQYLDLGPGLPTGLHTHDVVQRIQPEARVLYVDNDPIVLAHGHALLATNDKTQVIAGDIYDPDRLLAQPAVAEFLDLSRPIALLHTAPLRQHPDGIKEEAVVMGKYVDALATGSYTALTHLLDPNAADFTTSLIRQVEQRLHNSLGIGSFQPLDQIHALFEGQDLIDPGVVPCDEWPTDAQGEQDSWVRDCVVGGVARKPERHRSGPPL